MDMSLVRPDMGIFPDTLTEKRVLEKLFNCYMYKTGRTEYVDGAFTPSTHSWESSVSCLSLDNALTGMRFTQVSAPYDGYYYYEREHLSCDTSFFRSIAAVLMIHLPCELPSLLRMEKDAFFSELREYGFFDCSDGFDTEDENLWHDILNGISWLYDFLVKKKCPYKSKYQTTISYFEPDTVILSEYMSYCMHYYQKMFALSMEATAGIFPCIAAYLSSNSLEINAFEEEAFIYLYMFSSRKLGNFLKWKASTPYISSPEIAKMCECAEVLKYPFSDIDYGTFSCTLTSHGEYVVAYNTSSFEDFMLNPTYLDAHDTFFSLYPAFEKAVYAS